MHDVVSGPTEGTYMYDVISGPTEGTCVYDVIGSPRKDVWVMLCDVSLTEDHSDGGAYIIPACRVNTSHALQLPLSLCESKD